MMAHRPLITAHTGCDGTPENSMESAIAGIDNGADFVEVDVRTGADGVAFLSHDEPIAGGARPERLDVVMDAVLERDGRLNLDLKDDRSVASAVDLVRSRRAEHRVVLTGSRAARAAMAHAAAPEIQVYLDTGSFLVAVAPLLRGVPLRALCRRAVNLGCCGLNIHHRLCTGPLVREARHQGLLVSVWTVSPEDGFGRFVDMGVDNITTRHVRDLAAFLGRLDTGPAG